MNMQVQKEVISIHKQQAVKKGVAKNARCEIKGGGQKMTGIIV